MNLLALKSAVVSGVLMGLLGVAGYVIGVGDIFHLDYHVLVNVGVMSALTSLVSLVKSAMTTNSGTVAGIKIVK